MNKKDKIAMARAILNNATNMNINRETVLKISRKIDQYIVEYYLNNRGQKDDMDKEEYT